MKVNSPNTQPVSQPVETAAPAKPAEAVRPDVSAEAPVEQPPQLTPDEAAQQTKARDGAARAQFAQRAESLDGRLAGVEGAEVAQLTPQQFVRQAQGFVDQIAANPENAAAKHKEVGKALDKLSNAIGGMDGEQAFAATGELINLDFAVDHAKGAVERKMDFAEGAEKAGLEQVWQKLDRLDQAIDKAQHA